MERYQVFFIVSLISALSILIIVVFGIKKLREKQDKRLPRLLLLFMGFSFLSIATYTVGSYITWKIPADITYETQGLIFNFVFIFNLIATVYSGEFINEVFYERKKKITYILWTLGLGLALLFLLGGILGFDFEPKAGPPNNNDLKFEYYIIYNLFYFPLIIWAISKIVYLTKRPDISGDYKKRMKNMIYFYISLGLIFIFAIGDIMVPLDFILFGVLTQFMIPFACIFGYNAFFSKSQNS